MGRCVLEVSCNSIACLARAASCDNAVHVCCHPLTAHWVPFLQDVPVLSLVLSPRAVLSNDTLLPVSLEAGGAVCATSAPGTDVPFDWQPLQQRPRTGRLILRTSSPEGLLLTLRSPSFALEPCDSTTMECYPELPGWSLQAASFMNAHKNEL